MKESKDLTPKLETYPVKARCNNCDRLMTLDVPRGIAIGAHLKTLDCPNCGCRRIVRNYQVLA